jgi:DNA-binding CsgD family transcriptional regulator
MNDIVIPKMMTQTFDQFKDPIAIVDKHSRILHANLSIAKLCGFRTADGLIDRHYDEVHSTLFEDEDVINQWKEQDKAIINNPLKELKMLEVHPGSVDAPYIVRKMPLYSETRECVGTIHHIKYLEIFSPNDFIRGKLPGSLLLNRPDDTFTERECEVAFFKLQGMTSKEIGNILCLSPRTIECRLSAMYIKAGASHIDEFRHFCETRNLHRYLPQRLLSRKLIGFKGDYMEDNAGE